MARPARSRQIPALALAYGCSLLALTISPLTLGRLLEDQPDMLSGRPGEVLIGMAALIPITGVIVWMQGRSDRLEREHMLTQFLGALALQTVLQAIVEELVAGGALDAATFPGWSVALAAWGLSILSVRGLRLRHRRPA